ncbi:MAG: 4-hydroxy-tetrahydrodipicolinate synthase [Bacteroidales bacterium]|nr:4-hydroxy-tetrahydrodipicolinate synthase [Bacteroidales bacterium]
MNNFTFTGTGVALITPFKPDFSIDTDALKRIVDHVIAGGVEYIVALGTTSEAPTLATAEKQFVTQLILQQVNGRVPVVKGVGGNNTDEVVNQLKYDSFEGIAAVLSVTPYYNKPGQAGLLRHFDQVAEASPVPVILYNVPGRTSVNMKAETTLELARRHPNIVAIKEASGDFNQMMEIIANKPPHFELISGDDSITFPLIAAGAKGVISVAANAFTRHFTDMVRAALFGDLQHARDLQYRMLQLYHLLFAEGSPSGVKALMNQMKLCENVLRLPLVPASEKLANQLVNQWNLLNR